MPIRHTFYHPDRLVIAVAAGAVSLVVMVTFARAVADAGVVHYRKIVDVAEATPIFTEAELMALAQYMRDYPVPGKRGALAFVTSAGNAQFAKLFSSFEMPGRPSQVFRSIHDARKWIAANPPED